MRSSSLLLLIASSCYGRRASAFSSPPTAPAASLNVGSSSAYTVRPPIAFAPGGAESSSTALFKGLKGNAKRQMDLAKKLALAKEQKARSQGGGAGQAGEEEEAGGVSATAGGGGAEGKKTAAAAKRGGSSSGGSKKLTDAEMKAENDRKRFDDLLNSESATAMFEFNTNSGYLTREQEEEAATAGFRGVDRKFEGDPAPTDPFEGLVSAETENALGEGGPARLVPWLHRNSARHNDYLIVITDPREKSTELRSAVKSIAKQVSKDVLGKMIVVNADAPPENRRWLKKNDLPDVTIYSDEKREWMREYTALGEKRWTMCMFILGDGRIQKLVRELDGDLASTVVQNAVRSLDY